MFKTATEGSTSPVPKLIISQLLENIKSEIKKNQENFKTHKRKHQQINPIVRDGKVRDEYQDLLDNKEYTPESIEQWDKKAVSWIDKIGGIKNAAEAIINDDIRHSDRHVNTLIIRHILNSDIAEKELPIKDRVKLKEINISNGTEWGTQFSIQKEK